jgi:hypothetical protein
VTRRQKSLVLTAVHVALVASLGAKLLADRTTRPRVWARTAPIDPDLPIRGRYVRLRIEVEGSPDLTGREVELIVLGDKLIAAAAPDSTGLRITARPSASFVLERPLAFFIPEHVEDPSRRAPGEELWVEVTIPRRGPPRPIRLGVWRDGTLTPLELR